MKNDDFISFVLENDWWCKIIQTINFVGHLETIVCRIKALSAREI